MMLQEDLKIDFSKKWLDSYFTFAKKAKSKQSGFLHFCKHDPYNPRQDIIPIAENMLFALACFKVKTVEAMAEGKAFLERLFAFEVDGCFPIYLHEFPLCKDPFQALKLIPVLHLLTKDYRLALGESLLAKVNDLQERIIKAVELKENIPADLSIFIDAFHQRLTPQHPQTARQWEMYLLALQMMPQEGWVLGEIERSFSFWNAHLALFTGEEKALRHQGYEPERGLFDMMMFFMQGKIPEADFSGSTAAGFLAPLAYPLCKGSSQSCSNFLLKTCPLASMPLCLYWQDLGYLRSISVASEAKIDALYEEGRLTIDCTFHADPQFDDDHYELSLFLDDRVQTSFFVEGAQATMFTAQQPLLIKTGSYDITMQLHPLHGDPYLTGHIMKGSRPSQQRNRPFEALDWKIALRTIRRKKGDSLKVILFFNLHTS
jgi:hypothetical protein